MRSSQPLRPSRPSAAARPTDALCQLPDVAMAALAVEHCIVTAPTSEASDMKPRFLQQVRLAVWVDEAVCIGCRYCAHVAANTFVVEPHLGRSRAIRQDGDSTECIQEAIDTCPVDCIHWVPFESLETLKQNLIRQNLQPRPQG